MLEDSAFCVRTAALETLGWLEPATLAQYADAVVGMLEDVYCVRAALKTLGALEPATLGQHAHAVLLCLEHSSKCVREAACIALRSLPRYITTGYISDPRPVRSRLLGRLAWYRCRLRWRVQRLAFYWDELPYRPSGPGHARDVEAWGQMTGAGNFEPTTEGTREGGRKKKSKYQYEKDDKHKKKPTAKNKVVKPAAKPATKKPTVKKTIKKMCRLAATK